ncbi:MAG: tRNA (adenosine(37)-N6)-threonylcarbamoyltransferase complex ATPase subunit type 1 TsaE, partial [Myxococcota bacterium]
MRNKTAWSRTVANVAETQEFARRLGGALPWGSVIGLVGSLGAGKTHFVQGLAAGLGVLDVTEVVSPTYALMHEYPAADGIL